MGQYFKPIILGEQTEEGHETVKGWLYSHDYDNGLKLMEHSYQGNNFVSIFEKQLTRKGGYYKSRVVWAGDYADNEPNRKIFEDGKEEDVNLYSLCSDENKIFLAHKSNTDTYPYIVNHTKKLFVDKNKVPEIKNWKGAKIHPLPLLTCEGNGRGGGDFSGNEKDIAGSWARNVISVEKTNPLTTINTMDYEELIFDLNED